MFEQFHNNTRELVRDYTATLPLTVALCSADKIDRVYPSPNTEPGCTLLILMSILVCILFGMNL